MSGSAVSYRQLTKRYGPKVAVNEISVDIPTGSFFGICGPNGAGKTTLLRMTCGLLRPDFGTVEVAGHDVWTDPVGAKTRLGMVPDNPTMFTRLGGRELIEFNGLLRGMPAQVVSERTNDLLRLLDLEEASETLVADYSLGMTKKVAIACALLHSPKVLFLDEPFAGIDPVSRQVLETILSRFTQAGGTVVFSDHTMDVVERLCDRVMIIDDGSVLAEGPTGDITGGRRLQDVFVEMVGGGNTEGVDLGWLGSSFD
jgi:ABC-2 type transport system ATP-binding protein